MSLFKTILTALRGHANNAAEAIADDQALVILDQNIRDADKALNTARQQHTEVIAKKKLSEQKVASLKADIDKYSADARQHHESDPKLALKCAGRVKALREELTTEEAALNTYVTNEAKIAASIKKASDDLKRMRQQVDLLKAQGSVIAAQTAASTALSDGTSSMKTAMDQMDRVRQKQELQQAKLNAAEEQQDIATGADLDRELAAAAASRSDEDELAAILGKK
jgi:phage shock protein A